MVPNAHKSAPGTPCNPTSGCVENATFSVAPCACSTGTYNPFDLPFVAAVGAFAIGVSDFHHATTQCNLISLSHVSSLRTRHAVENRNSGLLTTGRAEVLLGGHRSITPRFSKTRSNQFGQQLRVAAYQLQ